MFIYKIKVNVLWIFLICGSCKVKSSVNSTVNDVNQTVNVSSNEILDIPYSDHHQTKFDIYMPASSTSTPLVIYVHGGGFTGGDKGETNPSGKLNKEIKSFLTNKIAFATINYRLLERNDSIGVKKCLLDVKTCLQFICLNAGKYNIDKSRIGLFGSSAGAGSILWLGLNDDMAIQNSPNPMYRESTRVKAIAASATQATYDLEKWKSVVFMESPMTRDDILGTMRKDFIYTFYGVKNKEEYLTTKIDIYRRYIDMLELMSNDDPPIWIENLNATSRLDSLNLNQLYHHYKHAESLQNQAKKTSIVHYVHLKAINQKTENWTDVVSFFKKYL